MATWLDRIAGRLGYTRAAPARRAFAGAAMSRLTSGWATSQASLNSDLKSQLNILRARSRDLSLNNDYAKKFLQMVEAHVVGPNGFQFQSRVKEPDGRPDSLANSAIEGMYWKWAAKGVCDVSGKLSFVGIQRLVARTVARDGEALVRKVYGLEANKFGFGLQVLAVDRLDVDRNEDLRGGNVIRMGVEMTRYGRPVAYHVRVTHPGDGVYTVTGGAMYERIPANEIYHLFVAVEPEQIRGVPWMHTAIMRLQNLGGFEEAAVIAARIGASKMGFFKSPDGDGLALADDTDAAGNLLTEADPGHFSVMPAGYEFQGFNPDYPTAAIEPFIKSCLRGVASGLGVAYNTLSNDLEGVNFSSIRTGVLEERDNWMVIQNWLIEAMLSDVSSELLRMAMLNGQVTMPNGSGLPLAKFDKFNSGSWQGRRWAWVDPRSDAETAVLLVNNKLKSRRAVIAESGADIEDVWAELQAEDDLADAMNIELGSAPETPAAPPPGATQPA